LVNALRYAADIRSKMVETKLSLLYCGSTRF